MKLKKNINTNLSITIILVFASLFTIIDFIIVGSEIDGYPFTITSTNSAMEDKGLPSDNIDDSSENDDSLVELDNQYDM